VLWLQITGVVARAADGGNVHIRLAVGGGEQRAHGVVDHGLRAHVGHVGLGERRLQQRRDVLALHAARLDLLRPVDELGAIERELLAGE